MVLLFIFFATMRAFLLLRMDRIGTLLEGFVVVPPRAAVHARVDTETDEDDNIIDNIISVIISKLVLLLLRAYYYGEMLHFN